MSGTAARGGPGWLMGAGAGLILPALARETFGSLAFPSSLGAAGFLLLTHSGRNPDPRRPSRLSRGVDWTTDTLEAQSAYEVRKSPPTMPAAPTSTS
jgi:hypothetical protein